MEPSKWKKRIAAGELSFDLERKAYMDAAIRAENCSTWQEVLSFYEEQFKRNLPGGDKQLNACADPFMKPLPGEKIITGLVRVSNYAAKKCIDAEDHSLNRDSDIMAGWRCWASATATIVQSAALFHPDTRLFLVDAEMARDVIKSRNDRVSGCDIKQAPFPLTWVDLSEPVKFTVAPSGLDVGMKAISLACVPGTDLQVVTVLTDFKIPGLPIHATIYLLFNDESCICIGMENELQIACASPATVNFESSVNLTNIYDCLSVSVKNIIDFLTSRSFSYVDCRRDHIDLSKIKKYRHIQGLLSSVRRDYKLVVMSRDIPRNPPPGRREEFEPGYSVDIPGCFHRWVYCGTCGDCHRHDLIGRPCRKCGLVVGPQLNIRIERYWHPPYVWGHGPRKEYARHLLP